MPDKLRIVLDTSSLVSAIILPRSKPRQAFSMANRAGYFLLSEATIREADDVLLREVFDRYISREDRLKFWSAFAEKAVVVPIKERVEACRDPKDDKFLNVAINGRADVIISSDKDLKALHPFQGIPILTPVEFLEWERLGEG